MNTPMHPTYTLNKEDQGSKVDQKMYHPQIKQRIIGVKSASVKTVISWQFPTSLKFSINRDEDLKN